MNQPNIAVLSGYYSLKKNHTKPKWLATVIKNHQNYCRAHGYQYFFRDDYIAPVSKTNNADPFYLGAWSKPQFIKDLLSKEFDYVFWIDSDSIFTNFKVGFEDLIATNKNIIFTGDCYDTCNSGHLFVKNSDFSISFLDQWDKSRKINCLEIDDSQIGFELTDDGFSRSDQTNIMLFYTDQLVLPGSW
jgi:galactosyl transferase GMA12/MNN10 family